MANSKERKCYSFQTRFVSLRDELSIFLKLHGIYYECSGGYSFYHFEVLCNKDEVKLVNNFLDGVSIIEERDAY